MGKKFKKRFRGLCPCTKTSPTPEVEDGGKMDTGRKVGVKEKQPNALIVTPKSQQLSKFDQMILEIEAMYANLTEKLDHRHKSLDKFAKVIFGDKYLVNGTVQGGTDQSKPNTNLTQGGQENRISESIIQPNINVESFEDKPKDHIHKVRETHKRSSFSDAILYQWMTKHMAASDNNHVNTIQPSNKTADMKHIENDKAKHDEAEEVLYLIDRVFIVDPRISYDRKMVKIGKADMGSINAIHNMDKSIGVKNTKRDWACRMQIVNISNIVMVPKADTPVIIADSFVSPHISSKPNILDLRKVYGIVAEGNQVSDYLPPSQRVEKSGSYYPRQIALALSYLGESIQQLQNSRSKQRMHFSLDFGHLAATGFQAQILRQVIKILEAVSQFSLIDQQALVPGRRHAIQISTVFGKLAPIGLHALVFLISVAFGKFVPTGLRIQTTVDIRRGQISLDLSYPAQTNQQFRKSGKYPLGQIAFALDYPVKTSLRLEKTGKYPMGQTTLALDSPAKKSLRLEKTGKYPLGQIAFALDYPAKTSLRLEKTGKYPLGQIAFELDSPAKTSLRLEKTRKYPLRMISFALNYPAKTSLRLEKTGKNPLGQIAFALDSPAKTILRLEKTGKYPLRMISFALDYPAKTSLGLEKTGKYPLGQIAFALDYPAKTSLRPEKTGKCPQRKISFALDYPVKTIQRLKNNGNKSLGQIALALDYPVKISLRTRKTGNEPLGQIALASDYPVKTSLRAKNIGKDPLGQIAFTLDFKARTSRRVEKTAKDPLGQIALALDYPVKISLRARKTGNEPLGQITLALDHPVKTSLRAKNIGKDPLGQIALALDYPAKIGLRAKKTGKDPLRRIAFTLDFLARTNIRVEKTGKDPLGQIALALDYPVKTSLRAKKTGTDPLGQIAFTLDFPARTSIRVEKTGKDPLGQIALALDYPVKTSLRAKKTGTDPLEQIAFTLDYPAKTSLRSKSFGTDPLGQITLALDFPVKSSLRTKRTGEDPLEQILLAFGHLTSTNQQAKKTEYERFKQIFVAIGHFAAIIQNDENIGTEHIGQVSLPFDKYPFNPHRVQKLRREQLRKMLLVIGTMVTASFQDQKYENDDHGNISAFGHQTLIGLPANTTRNAFSNQVSTMQLGLKQVFIVVDLSILSHRSVLKRPALNGQQVYIPSISEYFPLLTSQSHLAVLKEEMNNVSNSGSCIALLAVGMLTSLRTFEGTKTAVTDSICFRLSYDKDVTESLEMKTAQPIRDMFGPSHKIAEFAGLEITKESMTVGSTSDLDGSLSGIDQSDDIKVLERISTPEPKADSVAVYCCFAKPTSIMKPKGKSTVGQIHGVFGICPTKDESAGLKDIARRTSDNEDLSLLRTSRYIVQPKNYHKWKPTAELTPDRLGFCRAADLVARMDKHTEKTIDIDSCSNKTPIISVRSVSVGSSTEDEVVEDTPETALVSDESKYNDCVEGKSEKSHIKAYFAESNTDRGIPKTKSRTSNRNTQDKSTDTRDLPRPNSPTPVAPKGPVPGSTFGRRVLEHEVMGNLQELMDKGVHLDESHAKFLCINLLDILKYLLTRGVIHTNICPRNIFLDEFGYPCLTGYDKCIYIGSDPHTRRKFRPVIEYCSPEQAMKTYVTEATDVFSVGVLCFNVIYGRPPHQGKTYKETRDNIVNNNFIPTFEPDGLLSRSGKFFLVSCIRYSPIDTSGFVGVTFGKSFQSPIPVLVDPEKVKDLDKRFNVRKCGQSLVRSVKWFNDYDEKALLSHTMPSPFLQLLKN